MLGHRRTVQDMKHTAMLFDCRFIFIFFELVDVWVIMVLDRAECILPCGRQKYSRTSTAHMDKQVRVLVMIRRECLS